MRIAAVPGSAAHAASTSRHTDAECRERATSYLARVAGCVPDDLMWDDTFHLQAHAHLRGHELVVIAPRDDEHQPVVLTAMDWDDVRLRDDNRQQRIQQLTLSDPFRLREALRFDLASG